MLFIMSCTLMESMYPQKKRTAGGTNTVSTNLTSTNLLGTNAVGTNLFTTNQVSTTNAAPQTVSPIVPVAPPVEEQLVTLETDDSQHAFTSLGGGSRTSN